MDYSQLSDFEINSAVHNAKLKEPYALVFMGDDRIAWTKENGDQIITDKVPYTKNGVHDYCNNPADAWPIIVDNEISLNSYSGTWEASYEYDAPIGAFGTDELVTKAVEGKNPLRTAMIAFLMKREHSNA
ncbi:DUF2591 family protein [Salmonella enterica]|uniref:Protein ninX n=1 Tax=Salmonella enterica subsp. enterica serovar Guildford TaxID=2564497 RepID=A0A636P9M8_SALET|nr:DUF2591 domain-containing protein [Salmonella enterica]EBV1210083.1 protein ninX [Salmonella enterica subsp. enterica serovar Guildford]EDI1036937.1 protein ninX [Salmonella enterica subsp. enterica serovar Guildford]EDQ7217467.1 DUF2591 domain-containing protein [Salmonella enterica subsp. enterica]EIX4443288.1 DUF2591 family protein [Salmonella enterica]